MRLELLLHAEYLTLPIVRLQFLLCDIFLSLERSIEFLNIGSSSKNGPVVFLSKSKKAFFPKAKLRDPKLGFNLLRSRRPLSG